MDRWSVGVHGRIMVRGDAMSWDQIPGRAAYLWIYDEWIASNPRKGAVVVEVGVALGKSIAYLCDALEKAGRDDVIVYGVDAWGGFARNGEQTELADAAGGDFTLYVKTMLERAPKALERVRIIRARSSSVVMPLDHAADLVILDADHTLDEVARDISAWRSESTGDAWMGGDDYEPQYQGVIDAVHDAFGADIEVRHDSGWGTWLHRGGK